MAGGLVGLAAMKSLLSSYPPGLLLQGGALVLFLWARVTFGWRSFHLGANPTEGGLVTSGPYRYIRHPIYAALCFFIWVGVVGHWSWSTVMCGGVVLGGTMVRIFCEEKLVTARYPEYRQYAAKTWRMIPYLF
jgi:protein-S-isoprenylcysteine O-methyltransferase Ste14